MTTTPILDRPPLDQVEPPPCGWFALCDRPATHTRHHPILGDIPICDDCEGRIS